MRRLLSGAGPVTASGRPCIGKAWSARVPEGRDACPVGRNARSRDRGRQRPRQQGGPWVSRTAVDLAAASISKWRGRAQRGS